MRATPPVTAGLAALSLVAGDEAILHRLQQLKPK